MKKTIIAIAAVVVPGSAFAQDSGIVLYGLIDVGVEYANRQPDNAGSVTRMTSGNLAGSRWGLRGSEDLGAGYSAIFVLESGFDTDTGKSGQNSRLFGRQAFVGLQNPLGKITLGRQITPFFEFGGDYDPMQLGTKYSLISQDVYFVSRSDNSVKYAGTFGSFSASALYSFGVDSTVNGGSEVPGAPKIGREYGVRVRYASGPFSIGAIYDQVGTGTLAASPDARIRRAAVAASFDIGPAHTFAGYRRAKAYDGGIVTGALAGAGNQASNLYWAGLRYDLSAALSLTGAAYYQDFKNTNADPWLFSLLLDYSLSKRTDIFTAVGYTLNRHGSNLGLSNGSSGFGQTTAGANQFGVTTGIRHRF
ncbi:porin [Cupriavidus sp. 2TAF22]|uniref:porin n=1 Tax=unclassified Cupriavidus TaxID=2640874 RepID=UPI003F91C6A1